MPVREIWTLSWFFYVVALKDAIEVIVFDLYHLLIAIWLSFMVIDEKLRIYDARYIVRCQKEGSTLKCDVIYSILTTFSSNWRRNWDLSLTLWNPQWRNNEMIWNFLFIWPPSIQILCIMFPHQVCRIPNDGTTKWYKGSFPNDVWLYNCTTIVDHVGSLGLFWSCFIFRIEFRHLIYLICFHWLCVLMTNGILIVSCRKLFALYMLFVTWRFIDVSHFQYFVCPLQTNDFSHYEQLFLN